MKYASAMMTWLVFLCCPVAVLGLPNSESAATVLNPIVVTASRVEKTLLDVPVRTTVISADTLEKQHARDMQTALKYAPGINLKDIHGKTGKSAWIQGFDANRVLVLIDGERVAPSTGSTVDLSQLSVIGIKQIEIVKGSASALYGSSAMGGVINIITQRPEPGWSGQLAFDAGTYGDKNREESDLPRYYAKAGLAYSDDRWGLALDIDNRNSDGYLIEKGGYTLRGEDGDKSNQVAKLSYQFSDNVSASVGYRGYIEDYIIHDSIAIPGKGRIDRSESVNSEHYNFHIKSAFTDAHDVQAKVYFENYQSDSQTEVERIAQIGMLSAEVQHDWYLNNNHIISSGLVFNQETLQQLKNQASELNGDTPQRDAVEAFIQWDYFLTHQWELLPGFRFERDSEFGSHFSPKISVMHLSSYRGGEGRFRVSIGNGYRVPNLKERYFLFDHQHIGYQVLGNADLEPESAWSYQLGYQYSVKNNWDVDANLFYNAIENLIETALSHYQEGIAIYQYANIEEAETYGFELSSSIRPFDPLMLSASYVLTQSKNKTLDKALPKRPEHVVKLGLDYSFFNQTSEIIIRWIYQSKEFTDELNEQSSPSYDVLDIKYNQKINQGLSIYLGIDNVFNVYRDPIRVSQSADLRPVPGRMSYAGLSYQF